MELLPKEELKNLIQRRNEPCVSIYMRTHRAFPETRQDPIRFKNLLNDAEDRLERMGCRISEVRSMLKPAKVLLKTGPFWQNQGDGLAVFIASDFLYHYRPPLSFDELLVVTDRFHIKPLLPLMVAEERYYYILALSQNEVRFFYCTRHAAKEIVLDTLPRSLAEALKYDVPEKQLQFHTRTPAGSGDRAAMYHGQGVGTDDAKKKIMRYFQQIDRGLQEFLRCEQAPLVLAGVDYLFPIYRDANSYPYLVEGGIAGNPEGLSAEHLCGQGGKIVEPYFRSLREAALSRYEQLSGSERASNEIEHVVLRAYEGRVDTLFVAVGVQRWGAYDPDRQAVSIYAEAEPGDEDLLDFAAVHTYLNGGTVYAVKPGEVPDKGFLAAIYRY